MRGTDGSNLGENVVIREEIQNRRNPRKRAATRSSIDLGENVEIREGNKNGRNLKRQAASKRGRDLGNKVEVREDDGLNLEEESFSMVRDLKEEDMEKGVEGNRRGRGRGRLKKASNLEDGNVGVGHLGIRQNVENVKLKPQCNVSTRRTRSSKRGEVELASLVEAMPAKRTRKAKNAEDVLVSSVMGTVVESKGLDMDNCKEVESINVVEDTKIWGGHGRKKKVGAEGLENVQGAIPEEKMNHEVSEKEVPKMVVDLKKQPCEELVDDASEKNVLNDTKNEQLKNTNVPDLEKMTLEGWFYYLEVYLPKQIYAATYEIIEDMRKQAIQFDDFMLQQQKEKSKLPSATEKTRS